MQIDVITIFPEYFSGILATSLLGKAVARGDVRIRLHQLRDFATDRHRTVDDTPYGGGQGMVLKLEPLVAAIEAIAEPGARRVLLTPRGRSLTQSLTAELARADQVVLVCGRYEGVDERLDAWLDERVCIGDYVLSGGEAAAAVVIDAVVRLVPGWSGIANRSSRSPSRPGCSSTRSTPARRAFAVSGCRRPCSRETMRRSTAGAARRPERRPRPGGRICSVPRHSPAWGSPKRRRRPSGPPSGTIGCRA
jgi:tRNA (guanine-N1)-methyltransferase